VKVELGLAEGKTLGDKRQSLRAEDWRREKEQLLKRKVQEG
jgi:tmRNA-binding protein